MANPISKASSDKQPEALSARRAQPVCEGVVGDGGRAARLPHLDLYFRDRGMVQHQLDSYNEFMRYGLARVIGENNHLEIRADKFDKLVDITIKDIRICTPQYTESDGQTANLTPYIARLKSLNYDLPIFMTLHSKYIENGILVKDENYIVQTCRMPVMLHSDYCYLTVNKEMPLNKLGECAYDVGGYFIINGNEKVLIAQERLCNNTLFISKDAKGVIVAEIRSCIDCTNRTTSTLYVKLTPPKQKTGMFGIRVTIPYVKEDIPAVMLLKALGLKTDKEIYRALAINEPDSAIVREYVMSAARDFSHVSMDDALEHIGKFGTTVCNNREKRIQYSILTLTKEMFPNIGTEEKDNISKAYYLGYVIHHVLNVASGRRDTDDRDDYRNKRIDLAGTLLSQLFRQLFSRSIKELKNQIKRRLNENKQSALCLNLQNLFNANTITKGISYSFSTGNWTASKTLNKNKAGVSQVLHRITFSSMISHLRRLSIPLGREGKTTKPRQLHNTQWFTVCPSETPEGDACGLVKNFSLMAHVSSDNNQFDVLSFITDINPMCAEHRSGDYLVILNGRTEGYVDQAARTAINLRNLRRSGIVPYDVSIVLDNVRRELRIHTDQGRLSRPTFILYASDSGAFHIKPIGDAKSWSDLLKNGVIEYIDHDEESWCVISPRVEEMSGTISYTHCEMHPSMILGVCASIIPFPHCNQSPRNCYQSSMGKQALGVCALNWNQRYDSMLHLLAYPQKPLVLTRAMDYMFFRELPAGQNAIIAVMCYSGSNIEDALIVNQAAVDRGMFRSFAYKSYKDEEKRHTATTISNFDKPKRGQCISMRNSSYDRIQDDGLTAPGERVYGGDVIVGKTMPAHNMNDIVANRRQTDIQKKDDSFCLKQNESGIVDRVIMSNNLDGLRFARVCVRSQRIPKVGDKLCIPVSDELLTDHGWIKLADLDIKIHKVATLVGGTHLDFVYPSYKYIYDHVGAMYEYKSNHTHILCTLNHKLYVKHNHEFAFMEAQNVYGKSISFKHDAICKNPNKVENARQILKPLLNGHNQFHTNDLQRANEMIVIALYAGWSAYVVDNNARQHIRPDSLLERVERANHSVIQPNARYTLVVNKNHDYSTVVYTESIIQEYSGAVGCIEISDTHLFYTRRNVWCMPYWSGNSSRAAQKGTIGLLMPHEDMPFTRDGITPDIIINPHCMMRMTIGQLLEMVLGKTCALEGLEGDGTAFTEVNMDTLCAALKKCGYQPHGWEFMCSGMTGKPIEAKIFIGPAYYQRLKHMVDDKIFCLPPTHEVLTARGWVFIDQVTTDDKVATLHNGADLVYEHPANVVQFDYAGPMYEVRSPQIELQTTPNHRMWASVCENNKWSDYQLIAAQDLMGKRVRYQKSAAIRASDYQATLRTKKGDVAIDMDAWLECFGKRVADLFECSLPYWVWRLSQTQARRLLTVIEAHNHRESALHIPSAQLSDDIMRLALHAGWSADKAEKQGEYWITLNKSECECAPMAEKYIDYAGKVYCLQVSSQVFYVRFNGKAAWTGNSRARGPVTALTRQALEGRSRGGGLRVGEMERDALIAHGSAMFLRERLFLSSDRFSVHVCNKCGLMCSGNTELSKYDCKNCNNTTDITEVPMPYVAKLLFHELMAMNIFPKIQPGH